MNSVQSSAAILQVIFKRNHLHEYFSAVRHLEALGMNEAASALRLQLMVRSQEEVVNLAMVLLTGVSIEPMKFISWMSGSLFGICVLSIFDFKDKDYSARFINHGFSNAVPLDITDDEEIYLRRIACALLIQVIEENGRYDSEGDFGEEEIVSLDAIINNLRAFAEGTVSPEDFKEGLSPFTDAAFFEELTIASAKLIAAKQRK